MRLLSDIEYERKKTRMKIIDLWNAGYTPDEMVKKTGLSSTTIYKWHERINRKPNKRLKYELKWDV